MRCHDGVRTEDCKCRQLFKIYISSNPGMWVNTVTSPANIEKLLKGKTKAERMQIVNEIDMSIEAFKNELRETLIDLSGS